jgi:predicted NUDIX family phosphoesterase
MEQVLVVERAEWFGGRWPQGFVRGADGLLAELEQRSSFVARPDAERNPAWKQLIPYCVVLRGTEVFCVRRHRAQSEARLHDLHSIGLGGHVGPDDRAPADPAAGGILRRALRRELGEELHLPAGAADRARFLGLLNDDATEVGRVHIGLVFGLRLAPGAPVHVRERTKMTGGFLPLAALGPPAGGAVVGSPKAWQDPRHFESWSRILLEAAPWHATEPDPHPESRSEDAHDG